MADVSHAHGFTWTFAQGAHPAEAVALHRASPSRMLVEESDILLVLQGAGSPELTDI